MKSSMGWLVEKAQVILPILCAAAFVTAGVVTLPHYGLTWDEGLRHMFFGERYFDFFTSLDTVYLDFDRGDLAIHRRPLNLYYSPRKHFAYAYPPLAQTLSAATMEIFAYRLGWLDPVDAFHLMTVLLSGLLLWVLFRFAAGSLGWLTAFLATLILSTYPRFWGDSHNNPKDIPEAVFFSFAVIAVHSWHTNPSWRRALWAGILFGASLAIKLNAAFIPLVVVLGIWSWEFKWPPWRRVANHLREFFSHYILMFGSAATTYFLLWPYLYPDPITRFKNHLEFMKGFARQGPPNWNWDSLIQAITTMPEVVLMLLLVGLCFALCRARRAESSMLYLLGVWLVVPILRNSVPGMVNYDGIRHFVEFVPAACLLAAYGGTRLVRHLPRVTEESILSWRP